jgi:hypothetical protein
MRDVDLFDESAGTVLERGAYQREFAEREAAGHDEASWKLERQQVFKEPGNASWAAFARGDWAEALRLSAEQRPALAQYQAKVDAQRNSIYRVRVVAEPIAPYLQWELNLLRIRAEVGEKIRIVTPEAVSEFEKESPLPELITLGLHTLYRIRYADDGTLCGAVRITDPESVASVTALAERLYGAGEDIKTFFERRVAHLPPPKAE